VSNTMMASLAPPPRYWPGENAPRTNERPMRRWRVLHVCDAVGQIAAVAEAQVQAGMRPSLLTPNGWYQPLMAQGQPATALSLVHEWQRVRRWRNRFAIEAVDQWAEILHAHCFAAAMAGLRGTSAVVYDLVSPIGAGIAPKPGAWLLRSLRVAEQVALSRAAAVVVHSQAMWSEALRRGVEAQDVFLVPDPVEAGGFDGLGGESRNRAVTLFAPDICNSADPRDLSRLLQAFTTLLTEIETARLLIEVSSAQAGRVMAEAAKAGVADAVQVIGPAERARTMAEAEIIVAAAPADDAPSRILIEALAHGRAILAADVEQNREVTPQGRGCLWYRRNDARDLAGRAAFLARNPDFRTALAVSGRTHVQATRSAKIVARKYDDVYRHAFQRRHRGNMDALGGLEMVRACL
jgi:glycosyltransferase involved in cell wall biosynthesis